MSPLMLMLADDTAPSFLTWLSPLLMVTGVIVLGVIAALLIRGGKAPADNSQIESETNKALQRVEDVRYQVEDVRLRVAELIATAQRLSARLDDKTTRLEALLKNADSLQTAREPSETGPPKSPLPTTSTRSASIEPKPRPAPQRRNEPGDIPIDPLRQSIYDLADAGHAPVDIARELNEHVGKIELILALREAASADQ